MIEPKEIVKNIITFFNPIMPLKDKRILITAGPTYEAIDPVRFIGNHSSGKMGFALAKVAIELGAEVILISGPSEEKISHPSASVVKVMSAENMFEKVKKYYSSVDIAISSAAVSDFKPKNYKAQKIKKNQNIQSIELSPTKDILAYMGEKKKDQYLVGFALETENEIDNAKLKLKIKNLDGIVLNSLNDKGSGFSSSTNKITFIHNDNTIKTFPLQSKTECAQHIFEQILHI